MTDKQENVLRKVRALIAKANSTEHEAERQAFLAKADQLMEVYAIDEAMLRLKEDPNAKLIVRKDIDMSWWRQLQGMDYDARNELYWLWMGCVRHCRCVTSSSTWNYREDWMAVFGTESDLRYLELLFTDLFIQMSVKIKPKYDPSAEIGSQVRLAKEAGMTWDQILDWSGLRGTALGKRLLPAYRKYCEEHGLPQVKINPKTYQWSYVEGFCRTIRSRLLAMRKDRDAPSSGSGQELALRSIADQALEEMYQQFPDLRPHPADCQCEVCVAARKPAKPGKKIAYRSRTYSEAAASYGSAAGRDARIVSNEPGVKGKSGKQLGG